jgi:hypothetical protein
MNSNRISDKNDDGILKNIDFIVDSNQKVRGNLILSIHCLLHKKAEQKGKLHSSNL